MENSILKSTKKILNVGEDYTAFDTDIITHINAAFTTLTQLGVGPENGFEIEDEAREWADFTAGDIQLNSVRTYVYLRVRLLFDPPSTSYLIAAAEKQVQELEWRLNVYKEDENWTDPTPVDP